MNKRLIVMLTIVLFFCIGCTKEGGELDSSDEESLVSNEDVTYEVSNQLTNIKGSYFRCCVKEDKFYVTAIQNDEEKKTDTIIGVYRSDLDGSNMQELSIPTNFEDKVGMSEFDFDDNQNIYYMYTYMEDEEERRELVKIGTDGKEIARTGLDGSFNISDGEIRDSFSVTADGIAVVFSRDRLYLLDEKFSLIEEIKIKDGELLETTISKDGEILCILDSTSDNENGYVVASLDMNSKTLNKFHNMHISEYYTLIQGSGNYDFYYTDEYGIYGYDIEKESGKKVFDYIASNVMDEDIKPLSNGNFIGEIELDEENCVLAIYSKKEQSADSQCKTLTFATLYLDSDVKSAIYEFNKSQSDIKIVIKDYSGEADPITKMNTDIIAGNIPDIFDLKELSVEQYVEKGLLEDLTSYYATDELVHESDLMPSILQAMKIDDKIYYVSSGFHVLSLAAKVSDVGTGSGWDYDDLEKVLSKKDKNSQFFYLNNKQELLRTMLWCQSTDFVDKNTGICYFDSEDFKKLLKICNERGVDEEDYEWSESEAMLLRNGDILFRDASTDIDHFKETLAAFDEDVNFIGYPNSDKKGNYINFNLQIGISAQSKYKKEAWQFLRTLMSKEYQGGVMSFEYLPTRQDCFQLRMEAEMATENYTNEMGREIFVYNGISDIDGVSYEIKPLTEKQAEQYVDMIKCATKVVDYDKNIINIVQEEAVSYFAGDRNLDDTVDIIQKRVTTYINESR